MQVSLINQETLNELLNKAIDLTDNKATYITNIRFSVSNNEVTLDMYYVSPNAANPGGTPIAQRVQRIIMPLGLAKNVGELLTRSMAEWEGTFGIKLPLELNSAELDVDEDDDKSE